MYNDPKLSQQLAFMSHPQGKTIEPHRHNKVTREVHYTQEVLLIQKGNDALQNNDVFAADDAGSLANAVALLTDATEKDPKAAGAWGSLALASRQPEGVIGVVNFAGGRGSVADNTNCDVPNLVHAAGEFGRTVQVPSIWLYAVNDLYQPPSVSRPLYDAFKKSTVSHTEYVELPAYGRDGHATFGARRAIMNWQPAVVRFLESLP